IWEDLIQKEKWLLSHRETVKCFDGVGRVAWPGRPITRTSSSISPILGYSISCMMMGGFHVFVYRGFHMWLNYVPGISFKTDNESFK
ncbi:hypothetical protein S83_023773, partial [Arachis hypogaea]